MERSRKAADHRVFTAHTLHKGNNFSGRCKLHILELSQNLVPRLWVEHLRYIGTANVLNKQVHETPVANTYPSKQAVVSDECAVSQTND